MSYLFACQRMIKHNFSRFEFYLEEGFFLENKISIFFKLTITSLMLFNKRMEKKAENEREREIENREFLLLLYVRRNGRTNIVVVVVLWRFAYSILHRRQRKRDRKRKKREKFVRVYPLDFFSFLRKILSFFLFFAHFSFSLLNTPPISISCF